MVHEVLTRARLETLEASEAAALLLSIRAAGWSDREQELLADWIASDERNRRAFESAEAAWRVFEDADGEEILSAMRKHAVAPRSQVRRPWLKLAAAASVLFAIGIAWLYMPRAETFRYSTAESETKELRLQDGSVVMLDAASELKGQFLADRRDVDLLRGRAVFTVAPDAGRPFAVTAAGRRALAVGTRFEVNLLEHGLNIMLFEGRVDVESLEAGVATVKLTAGQQYIDEGGKIEVRQLGDSARAPSWQQGFIEFDDQPLGNAVEIMNRYSAEKIVIDSPAVASLRVSGQFRAGESLRFAKTLAEMHRLDVVQQGNQIRLGPRS